MITFNDKRVKPEGGEYTDSRTLTVGKGLDILVNCELGFGGKILEVTPTRVVTQTTVMGCVDTSVFEGSVEEMHYLYEIAKNTQAVRDLRQDPDRGKDDGTEGDVRRLEAAIGKGIHTAKIGTIAALGVVCDVMVTKLASVSLKDLIAAVSLIAEGQGTPEEIIALI